MAAAAGESGEQVRGAELVGALCLATDLGMGFPFEHGLHTTLIAMRLADRLGVEHATVRETYYASLLAHSGCTTDAHVTPEVFGGSLTATAQAHLYGSPREVLTAMLRTLPDPGASGLRRAGQAVRRLPKMARVQRPHLSAACEVATMLGAALGLPASAAALPEYMFERWDGHGPLGRARGDEIPLAMRIVHVSEDAAFQRVVGGDEHAARVVRERAGHAFDPAVAACLADHAGEILTLDARGSAWDEAIACEPRPWLLLEGDALDRGLAAMGNFADLLTPYLAGHSTGVAELAEAAARRCGLEEDRVLTVRRAALVHDVGRVAVSAGIWHKPGPLTADELEQVRLHPYHSGRVLASSAFLGRSPSACAHHERLDGSGYHRAATGQDLALPARLLAAADAYRAMTEPRPHRPAIEPETAARMLGDEASAGRLDATAVTAVVEAAGQPAPRIERPAGLTEREAEVVCLLARGLQTKQVAGALGISAKTADRHIQNAYRKLGVSTRAAATLFAMEHGLLAWRLPIGRAPETDPVVGDEHAAVGQPSTARVGPPAAQPSRASRPRRRSASAVAWTRPVKRRPPGGRVQQVMGGSAVRGSSQLRGRCRWSATPPAASAKRVQGRAGRTGSRRPPRARHRPCHRGQVAGAVDAEARVAGERAGEHVGEQALGEATAVRSDAAADGSTPLAGPVDSMLAPARPAARRRGVAGRGGARAAAGPAGRGRRRTPWPRARRSSGRRRGRRSTPPATGEQRPADHRRLGTAARGSALSRDSSLAGREAREAVGDAERRAGRRFGRPRTGYAIRGRRHSLCGRSAAQASASRACRTTSSTRAGSTTIAVPGQEARLAAVRASCPSQRTSRATQPRADSAPGAGDARSPRARVEFGDHRSRRRCRGRQSRW